MYKAGRGWEKKKKDVDLSCFGKAREARRGQLLQTPCPAPQHLGAWGPVASPRVAGEWLEALCTLSRSVVSDSLRPRGL